MEGEKMNEDQPMKPESDTHASESAEDAQQSSKPLTEEEKAERLRRAEERIKQRRLEIQEQERKKEIEREKSRRKEGQDIVKIKAEMEWREAQKMAEQKKKEKREDKLAKQRILEEIARDRANMKAKALKASGATNVQSASSDPVSSKPAASSSNTGQAGSKKEYTEAKIQIRLPDNTKLIQSFGVDEPLSSIRVYTELNSNGQLGPYIDLSTTFPRKVFSGDEMQMSLRTLGLVPSAVILATKGKNSAV